MKEIGILIFKQLVMEKITNIHVRVYIVGKQLCDKEMRILTRMSNCNYVMVCCRNERSTAKMYHPLPSARGRYPSKQLYSDDAPVQIIHLVHPISETL